MIKLTALQFPSELSGRGRCPATPCAHSPRWTDHRIRSLQWRADHSIGMDVPNAVGLVYIATFGLDKGESTGTLPSHAPPAHPLPNLQIDAPGFAWLAQADFVNHFAPDVDPDEANVMHAVQQPAHIGTLSHVMGLPVWSALPT